MSEAIILHDKKQALKLAYQIITDKRNVNRYSNTSIVYKDRPDMFTYSDMLRVFNDMYKELHDTPEKLIQKPMTLGELHALIDAGEEAVIYCETEDDEANLYATLLYGGRIYDRYGEAPGPDHIRSETYGKTWRAWASRPTDEERSAAPWEETCDADL